MIESKDDQQKPSLFIDIMILICFIILILHLLFPQFGIDATTTGLLSLIIFLYFMRKKDLEDILVIIEQVKRTKELLI